MPKLSIRYSANSFPASEIPHLVQLQIQTNLNLKSLGISCQRRRQNIMGRGSKRFSVSMHAVLETAIVASALPLKGKEFFLSNSIWNIVNVVKASGFQHLLVDNVYLDGPLLTLRKEKMYFRGQKIKREKRIGKIIARIV